MGDKIKGLMAEYTVFTLQPDLSQKETSKTNRRQQNIRWWLSWCLFSLSHNSRFIFKKTTFRRQTFFLFQAFFLFRWTPRGGSTVTISQIKIQQKKDDFWHRRSDNFKALSHTCFYSKLSWTKNNSFNLHIPNHTNMVKKYN